MIRNTLSLLTKTLLKKPIQQYSSKMLTSNSWARFGSGCCKGKKECSNNNQTKKQTEPSQQKHEAAHHEHHEGCSHHNHHHHHHHHHGAGSVSHNSNKDMHNQQQEHVHGPNCNHDHSHQHQQIKIPKECLDVVTEVHELGQEKIESSYTRGSVSILNQIKGAKQHARGELYVLMFTCNRCNTKSIRSFTKVAYHQGVVLIRCEGCENIHLIADNIGWFEDEKTNIETMGKVDKVTDPVAVTKILKHIFQKNQAKKPHQEQKHTSPPSNNS